VAIPTGPQPSFTLSKRPPQGGSEGFGVARGINMVRYTFQCTEPHMSFHVDTIPDRRGRDTILLGEAWREGRRVRKRAIANLTDMPPAIVRGIDASRPVEPSRAR